MFIDEITDDSVKKITSKTVWRVITAKINV